MEGVKKINGYLEQTAPWKQAKTDKERTGTILLQRGRSAAFFLGPAVSGDAGENSNPVAKAWLAA